MGRIRVGLWEARGRLAEEVGLPEDRESGVEPSLLRPRWDGELLSPMGSMAGGPPESVRGGETIPTGSAKIRPPAGGIRRGVWGAPAGTMNSDGPAVPAGDRPGA